MKLFKNLFKREASKKTTSDNIDGVAVDRIEVERTDVARVDIPKTSILTMKFRDMTTGEIRLVDYNDDEGFDECMSNKNMQIIIG